MFKFLKEIVDSFKEGIAEGKEELKQEAAAKENENQNDFAQIEAIAYDEKFGTALGAPFRVVVFGDWFTLFKSSDDDTTTPLHLYTFNEYPAKEKHEKELAKLMERDFDIHDTESCKSILASYFKTANIDTNQTILEGLTDPSVDEDMWDVSKEGVPALICAVTSHIITASTDIGYITKNEALILLNKVNNYAKQNYNDWHTYADAFMLGDENIGLNNAAGRGVLKKFISYLKTKKGSPWNTISWNA